MSSIKKKVNTKPKDPHEHKIGLNAAIAIGIGGMVGGGIFAVLGLTIELAHSGATMAFFLAGLVCLLTAYSYSKLSICFPHEGGTIEFINQGFGKNLFSGSLNMLLWLSYIVMIALYAFAFGSFGSTFFPESSQTMAKDNLIVIAVLGSTFINILSAKFVGKSEIVIVYVKLIILVGIVLLGVHLVIHNKVDFSRLAFRHWADPFSIITGGFLIFLAYEGFELIANSAEDIKHPKKNLPRAYYISVSFVIFLYVLAATMTVGVLPLETIVGSRDYVLAEVARVLLQDFGFNLVVIAALLSTFSAISATLYGNTRLTRQLAHAGQFPKLLLKEVWGRPIAGLLMTSSLGLILALTVDLDNIATLGSIGFLSVFFIVNCINFRLRKKTKSNAIITLLGMIGCFIAFITLLTHAYTKSVKHFTFAICIFILSFVFEGVYLYFKKPKKRRAKKK